MATQEETVVFKVKYGDNIKRINGSVNRQKLDLNFSQLRSKILECFKITPEEGFNLTYIDEDGDTVLLGDGADLYDAAIKQGLNPLRIDMNLKQNPPAPQNPPAKINPDHICAVKSLEKDVNQKLEISSFKKSATPWDKPPPPSQNSPKQDQVEPTLKHAQPNWSYDLGSSASMHLFDNAFLAGPFALATSPFTGSQVEQLTLHRGVQCYKCGMNPIIGSYFKSYSEENCNYCAYCFSRSPKHGHYVEVQADDARSKRSLNAHLEGDELRMSTIVSSGGMPMMDKTHKLHDIPVGHCSKSFPNYHHGGQCEVCGANPIVGKSYTKKGKYKVCSFCNSRMAVHCEELTPPRTTFPPSNDHKAHYNTFASIDGTPVMHNDHMYFSRTYERYSRNIHLVQHRSPICLVHDVTIPVGTRLAPNTLVTKIWRIRNTSSFRWSSGTRLTKLCGIYGFSTPWDVKLEIPNSSGLGPQESVDVYLCLKAPSCPGNYSAWYSLAFLNGVEFGEPISIAIEVVANPSTSKNTTAIKMPGSPGNVAATKTHAVSVKPTSNTDNSEVLGKSKVSMRSCPPGNLGKGVAIVKDDDDLDEVMMVEELVQMGYGDKDLIRKVLRSNNYDLELAIDALECTSEDSPTDD